MATVNEIERLSAPEEPAVFVETGKVQCASARTRMLLQTYSTLGGILERNKWRGFRFVRRATVDAIGADFVVAHLAPDAKFRFPVRDVYWNRLLLRRFVYERPLNALLQSLSGVTYSFIDCGANFGIWSVLVSSQRFGAKQALAIEALAQNFDWLKLNCAINGDRFRCWHNAVHAEAGRTMEIFSSEAEHFGASLRADWHAARPRGTVATTTIAAAAATFEPAARLVIKLDVEGVEVEALNGGRDVLRSGALLAYEDHPRDAEHTPTQWLLSEGMDLWLLANRGTVRITSTDELAREKSRPDFEYNLLAFRPGAWPELAA